MSNHQKTFNMKYFILVFFLLLTTNYYLAQKPNIVKNEGIKTELYLLIKNILRSQ